MPGGRQGATDFNAGSLRAARMAEDLTQEELAEAAGSNVKEVREWESGRRVPQVDALARLARALHRSPLDFVDRDTDQALTLQHLRTANGLSQQQAAEAAGLQRGTYSQIERGEVASISTDAAAGMARAFGVTVADIVAAWTASRTARLQRHPGPSRPGRIRLTAGD